MSKKKREMLVNGRANTNDLDFINMSHAVYIKSRSVCTHLY